MHDTKVAGKGTRRCNLRHCTPAENTSNAPRRAGGKSSFIGISPRGDKWEAQAGGHYLGLFDDEAEAAKARDRQARDVYGEHARQNIPREDPQDQGQCGRR